MTKVNLRRLMLSLILITFSFSCTEENTEGNSLTVLNVTEEDLKAFDEVISEMEFIPLLIPEDKPISLLPFDPYLYVDNKIYFSNGDFRDASIHVFELDGTYQKSLNRQGEGPEEYRSISGLDKSGNELLVWDGSGTFSHFDAESLSFIRQSELVKGRFIPDYKKLGDGKWLLVFDIGEDVDDLGYHTGFQIWDENSNELKALNIKIPPLATEMVEGQFAQIAKDSYLMNFGTSDTLYRFEKGVVDPVLVFNFNNNNLPEKDKLNPEETIENALLNQLYSFNMGGIVVADGTVRIPVFGIKKSANMDPENMGTFPINYVFIEYPGSRVKAIRAFGNFSAKGFAKDGYFYELLYSEEVMGHLEVGTFGKYSPFLEEAVEKLIDKEDPVIMKYKVSFGK
jgi:hypothetical protein